jgi:hypothetical protein
MAAVAMVTLLPRCGGMTEGQETDGEAAALKAVEQQARGALAACHPQTRTVWNTLFPFGDVSVKEDTPGANFASEPLLYVDLGPINYESYLGFSLPDRGGRLVQAKLRLYARSTTTTGVNVHRMRYPWSETTTTWNTRPLVDVPVAFQQDIQVGTWAEFDVKDAVSEDRQGLSVGVTAAWLDGVEFASREAANSARWPRLETAVTYDWCTYQGTGASSLQWTRPVNGSNGQHLDALASVPGGGVVAGGWYRGMGNLGGARLPAPGGLFVARYTDAGLHQWSRAYAVNEQVAMTALTVTPLGNVLVVGRYHGAPDLGTGPLPYVDPTGVGGMFILKLSPNGTPVWAHGFAAQLRPPDSGGKVYRAISEPTAVATDANGSLVVTGYFQGYMDLGTGEIFAGPNSQANNDPSNGIFLAKFDYDGHPLWAQAFEAGERDMSKALAIDGNGSIYLGGKAGVPALAGAGARPHAPFITRFAPDGTRLWGRSLKGSMGAINGLAILPGGGVAFGGDYNGSFTFNGALYVSEDPAPPGDDLVGDAVYGTLGASGGDGWVRTPVDGGSGDSVSHVAVDAAGNVTVSGNASTDSFNLGGGPLGTPWLSPQMFLHYLASHGPSGAFRWSRLMGLTTSSVHLAVTPAGATRVGFNFADLVTTVDDHTFHGGTGLLQFTP